MPIKRKQKNKRKNRAVQNTALSKIDNRTNTIKVNVVSNMDTTQNKKTKPKESKPQKARNKKIKMTNIKAKKIRDKKRR